MRTRMFGSAYGRFDWISQFLVFLRSMAAASTRQIANNTVQTVWKRRPRIMVARPRARGTQYLHFFDSRLRRNEWIRWIRVRIR